MRKIISIFFLSMFLISNIPNVIALEYNDVINRVEQEEINSNTIMSKIYEWSNIYKEDLKNTLTLDFINNLKGDYNIDIDLIINELESNGYINASLKLSELKNEIIESINYFNDTLNILESYFNENVDGGVVGSTDLFIQIRESLINLKTPIKNIFDIYYDIFYYEIINKIDKYDKTSDLINLYENTISNIINLYKKYETRINNWQKIYNSYYLNDYEDLFKDYLGTYKTKIKEDIDVIYNKLEEKLQAKLDSKIEVIVNNTVNSSRDSIINRNNELYNIIDYIKEKQELVNNEITKINNKIEIDTILNYVEKYKDKIDKRLNEAILYTKSYLIDDLELTLKNDSDKTYIKIDTDIIIFKGENLDINNFINKLLVSYGNIEVDNDYNGNIGTLSKMKVLYNDTLIKELTLIVKGDVNPSGRIDITDIVNVCNKMFGKQSLDLYQTQSADMNDDSKIDITDIVLLCNMLFK